MSILGTMLHDLSQLAYLFRLQSVGNALSQDAINDGYQQIGQAALSAYDGLNTDPSYVISYPITLPDGSPGFAETSVASLNSIDMDASNAAALRINAVLSRLVSGGIFVRGVTAASGLTPYATFTSQNYSGVSTIGWRDPRLFTPGRLLQFPTVFDYGPPSPRGEPGVSYSSDPRLMPSDYPTLNAQYVPLAPTPRYFDNTSYPWTTIATDMEELASAVSDYLKARNVNPRYHPVLIAAQAPAYPPKFPNVHFQPSTVTDDYREYVIGGVGAAGWQNSDGTWNDLVRAGIKGWEFDDYTVDPAISQLKIVGTSSSLWTQSMVAGVPITTMGVPSVPIVGQPLSIDAGAWKASGFWYCVTADALLDFAQLVVAADAIMQTSGSYATYSQTVLLDTFASAHTYSVLQRRAYQQIGVAYDTSIAGFQAGLAAEATARALKQRSSVVDPFGMFGYNSTGSGSSDVANWTIDTLALALKAAAAGAAVGGVVGAAVGAVVAVVATALASLLNFITETTPPPDPGTLVLTLAQGGAPAWGSTPYSVIQSYPMVRVPHG